jgi:hypothetical protein
LPTTNWNNTEFKRTDKFSQESRRKHKIERTASKGRWKGKVASEIQNAKGSHVSLQDGG